MFNLYDTEIGAREREEDVRNGLRQALLLRGGKPASGGAVMRFRQALLRALPRSEWIRTSGGQTASIPSSQCAGGVC